MQVALVAAGIATFAVALSPPLDALGDRSFAWHMVQHVLLFFVGPALLLCAHPLRLAIARSRRIGVLAAAVRAAHGRYSPIASFTLFIGLLWIAHFSPWYEAALDHEWIHACEHLAFIVAGLAFWFPVVEPFGAPPSLGPPARLLYLFAALPQCGLIAIAIDAARRPLYSHYAATLGAAALSDQHNAAAVMWIACGLIVLVAIVATMAGWARREMLETAA
jgi:putative membrane protein